MRVTNLGSTAAMTTALSLAATRIQDASMDLSSGRRIRSVSDSPTDTATVLRYNAHQASLTAYKNAGNDALAWLQSTDTALQSTSKAVMSALTTLQSGESPAADVDARAALAGQLDSLRDHLFELANSTAQGRSLFGGFADKAVERAADGTVSFVGDGGQVKRQVSASQIVQVNTDGSDVFGFTGGDDVFKILADGATALRAGDGAGVRDALTRLEKAHTVALGGLEKVGNKGNAVQDALDSGVAQDLTLKQAKSALVDTDIAAATMDAQLAANAYQAALSATSQAFRLQSLADYLR